MKMVYFCGRLLGLGTALGLLIVSHSALAQATTAPVAPVDMSYYNANWTGLHLGGQLGGTFSDFGNRSGQPSGHDDAFIYGGDVGYDYEINRVVIGAEGDFDVFNNSDSASSTPGTKFDEDWMSTARARLGYAFGRLLPYATAGLAMTDTNTKVNGLGLSQRVEPGFAVGGGVDAMLMGNWFGRVEYLHVDVPNGNATLGGTTITGGSDNDIVRGGFGYRF